jgi:lysophospholipase L1-like esterase
VNLWNSRCHHWFQRVACVAAFAIAGHAIAAQSKAVTIGLIGDSTVATTYGWGPAFAKRCKDTVTVLNYAKNGATLDSRSRKLDELLQEKPDVVLVQFGHNDMKKYDAKDYGRKLTGYVVRIKRAGAKAVVLSSVTRRHFDETGKIAPRVVNGDRTLPQFAQSARSVAREQVVPFIDLNAISIEHHNRIGPEASVAYNFKETDRTHFSPAGAAAIANLIIQELRVAVPELAVHLK